MDIIFYNGRINTLDESSKVCTAVGVANGIVAALGSDAELYRLVGAKTETVDLKGSVMFPGFMEAHNHLMIYAYLIDGIDLSAARAIRMDDILTLVKSESEKHPPGTWIKGSRYAEYFLAENRHPTRRDLDQVSPQHPVVIYHTSFHACVLNSLALKILGIDRETESPQGGIVEKDPADGEPTGVLHDNAMTGVFNTLFFDDLAAMTRQQRVALCSAATQSFAAQGLVFAADAMVTPQTLEIYQDTWAAGQLKIRIYTMHHDIMAESLVEPLSQRPDERWHEVGTGHRGTQRRGLHARGALGGMGQIALEGGRSEGRPHQPLGQIGIGGVEGMEVGVGFPLFKEQLHLPTQPIDLAHGGRVIALTGQIGDQVQVLAVVLAPGQHQAPAVALLAVFPLHVQVHGDIPREVVTNALERLVAQC